jgi:hypothetical protein
MTAFSLSPAINHEHLAERVRFIGVRVVYLSATQLTMLLDGLDWTRASPKPVRQPALVG